jgi:hypothetical protein
MLSAGCGVETKQCSAVEGRYQALYTPLNGTCGPIVMPNSVPVETGYRGAPVMKVETFLNGSVSTEIVMKGCSMRMTQKVMQDGAVRSALEGAQINIENQNELHGTVNLTRYDMGSAICTGVYDARLTKDASNVSAGAM